jgi:hypothetical protein
MTCLPRPATRITPTKKNRNPGSIAAVDTQAGIW